MLSIYSASVAKVRCQNSEEKLTFLSSSSTLARLGSVSLPFFGKVQRLNYFACTLAVDRADGERKYLTGSFSPTLYGITMRSNSDSTSHKDSADRQGNFPNWHVRPRGLLGIPTLFSARFFCILLSEIVSFLS